MKLKDIDWNKKLIVFFRDEVKKMKGKILSKTPPVIFPERVMAHPWEHVDYIEKVTRLISQDNRKITIVTNSPYIIDHLTNLMKGARVNADEKYTRCGKKSAFIDKKDVGVYVCTGGRIKDAMPKKGETIKWDNLSEPSEWLCNVYFEMGE